MASEVVHIKFEKLTGMKGDIEGDFIAYNFGLWNPIVDPHLPVVFLTNGGPGEEMLFVFSQNEKHFVLDPVDKNEDRNYLEHFTSGVNFLIKEWSVRNGVNIRDQASN